MKFLPAMGEWYSGLLPYPLLLPAQLLILGFQLELSRELWAGAGPLIAKRQRLGTGLKWFSLVYFLVMAARYVLVMWFVPERRWSGGTIPIAFHWLLALYVYLLSRYYRNFPIVPARRNGRASSTARSASRR